MSKYRCTICGYVLDEAVGVPEQGVEAGTLWDEIPADFVCPLCQAPKSAFEKASAQEDRETSDKAANVRVEEPGDLSSAEWSALFSNLAKGCEKQYLPQESKLFFELSSFHDRRAAKEEAATLGSIIDLLNEDLSQHFDAANDVARSKADRGAQRALVWSEKVSKMMNARLGMFAKKGEALLKDADLYVCDICGFIYLGNDLPDVCPVCKVPNDKLLKIEGR